MVRNGTRFKVTFIPKKQLIVSNARGEIFPKGKKQTLNRTVSATELRILNANPDVKVVSFKEVNGTKRKARKTFTQKLKKATFKRL